MPHAERTIVIARPQGEVFAFFANGENDPRWRSGVTAIRRDGPLQKGARYTQRIKGPGGREVQADIEVTAFSPDDLVSFHGIAGPVRPEGTYAFRPVEGGTSVTFTLDAELTGIKKLLMARAVQKAMDGEVASLDKAKVILESAS